MDKSLHFSRIRMPGYATRDFATREHFEESLLPSMRALAVREGKPMQASFRPDVNGTWDIRNAEDQPTANAFVLVGVDGAWRKGPKFDEGFFTTHDGHALEDCGECVARWLFKAERELLIGTRVRVIASDLAEHVGLEGRVADWSALPRCEPMVTVEFDKPIVDEGFVRRHGKGAARRDSFRMEEIERVA